MASQEISFGILLPPIQALDFVGPMDILSSTNYKYVSRYFSEEQVTEWKPPQITFHFIGPNMDLVPSSGGFRLPPTTTFTDCPPLDYLLVGGTTEVWAANVPENYKQFIVERSKQVKAILTTCTGGMIVSATGLLDNTEATMNHTLIHPYGSDLSPTTKWNDQAQWVVAKNGDGVEFWTAAGAGAGMDMIAEFVRQNISPGSLNFATCLLEWQPRDIHGKPMSYMNGRKEMVEV